MSVLLAPDMTAPPEQGDRTARFLSRIDAVLPTLWPDSAKADFLDKQLKAWNEAYAEFICTEGASEPTMSADDPPHCSDFLLTITGLSARRAKLAGPRS